MIRFINPHTDVYFNLAFEEYLLHHVPGNLFLLWRSEKAAVLGKHQNALNETNYRYCRDHGIAVARRLSGGGTVYHDLGNINFTFISERKAPGQLGTGFREFMQPVADILNANGIPAQFSARNDLFVGDRKISGNAEHLFQSGARVLHHGTLLYDAQLAQLGDALHPPAGRYSDKAVKSVRSPVCNIRQQMPGNPPVEDFMEMLGKALEEKTNCSGIRMLQEEELKTVAALADTRYRSWEWNYGYSPRYQLHCTLRSPAGENAHCIFHIHNGIMMEIQSESAFFQNIFIPLLGKLRHKEDDLRSFFHNHSFDNELISFNISEMF